MSDLQSISAAASTPIVTSGQATSVESVEEERQQQVVEPVERRAQQPSDTEEGVGERVDIQA